MRDVLDDLRVAAGGLAVVGGWGQGAAALEAGAFEPHALHLALLRLGELGGYDDEAEVDHEEGADLEETLILLDICYNSVDL